MPRPQVITEKAAQPVEIQAAVGMTKEIAYVPKEAGEKTDVQIETVSPVVTVQVNSRETEFTTLTEEKQKFEKGKLVITEETQLKLEIKTPPQPRYSFGVGWGGERTAQHYWPADGWGTARRGGGFTATGGRWQEG